MHVIEIALFNMTTPMLSLQEPQDTFLSATSSDLNPIEHLWDEVQPRPPATVAELDASSCGIYQRPHLLNVQEMYSCNQR